MKKRRNTLRNLVIALAVLVILIVVLFVIDNIRNHPDYGRMYMQQNPDPVIPTLTQA